MTVAEILANEELRQHEFPVTAHKIFLAHAGVCPLPMRVAEAVAQYASGCVVDDQEAAVPPTMIRDTRQSAARLIGAQPEEIALVGPTSLGLSLVAAGLPLRKNDNVVIYFDDYPRSEEHTSELQSRGL